MPPGMVWPGYFKKRKQLMYFMKSQTPPFLQTRHFFISRRQPHRNLTLLRMILCNFQANWEMKIFDPPPCFACMHVSLHEGW